MHPDFSFHLIATDGPARTGEITTAHGIVRTPAFMPVGTQATIKGMRPGDVRAGGRQNQLVLGFRAACEPPLGFLRPTGEASGADGLAHGAHQLLIEGGISPRQQHGA